MKLTVLGAAAVSMIGAVAVTERDRTYRSEGWERFDPDAPAYTPPAGAGHGPVRTDRY